MRKAVGMRTWINHLPNTATGKHDGAMPRVAALARANRGLLCQDRDSPLILARKCRLPWVWGDSGIFRLPSVHPRSSSECRVFSLEGLACDIGERQITAYPLWPV